MARPKNLIASAGWKVGVNRWSGGSAFMPAQRPAEMPAGPIRYPAWQRELGSREFV